MGGDRPTHDDIHRINLNGSETQPAEDKVAAFRRRAEALGFDLAAPSREQWERIWAAVKADEATNP